MHILFANTGVQTVCVPLPSGKRFTTAQIGYGWQHCQCENQNEDEPDNDEPIRYPFIQWQIIQGNVSKLFLAFDTSLGDPELGFACDPTTLAGDFKITLDKVLDRTGTPLQGVPPVELCLRAATATAGEAKPVHLVVDFGNSRTGGLLLEVTGEVSQTAEMMPFELLDRYTHDAVDDQGQSISKPANRWFSSKTCWCNSPNLPAAETVKKEYYRETVKGLLGKKQVNRQRERTVRPNLFDDLSMGRLGREVDDVCQVMHAKGDFRTTVSSPKRYLWADDETWLEGAFWYMADPHDRCGTDTFSAKVQGPLLRFLHEDDRDFLLDDQEPTDADFATEVPIKPRHAPRVMMVLAMYELLCQVYMQINSAGYRSRTSDPARSREIRSLTMTYPSGMFQPERQRFESQVHKAVEIFHHTVGKHQQIKPTVTFSIDEASAVHLTYIWSELRMLGQDPRLWFLALSREHDTTATSESETSEPTAEADSVGSVPAGRRRNRGRIQRPGAMRAGRETPAAEDNARRELRIACIDIGGGTSDLMIARYEYQPGIDDSIQGQVMHQDGISTAGDQLVKRLLEKIVVPAFADAIGLEDEDVQLLFGPEVPKNRGFASQRVDWVNRLFVPLAEAYLQMAVDDVNDEPITHTDPEVVDPTVLESLEQACNKLRGIGYYNIQQELNLEYEQESFEDIVHEVFDELLFDFCTRIVEHDVDVILLAGQPTKLNYIQELVRRYVPLPASRIIPMFNHYAGNWYPYQDAKGHAPGLIVDPKSAVVVGAAIEFLARNGLLPQFKFGMQGKQSENTYYWGVVTETSSTIREERILFHPVDENTKDEWTEFTTIAQRVVLGRKMAYDESAQATPIYAIRMDAGNRIGETEVTIRVRRVPAEGDVEEYLEFDSVSGTVAGEPAVQGENVHFTWRTLADERFFLDTGGLDNIEIEGH